jgi:hypothetical protein
MFITEVSVSYEETCSLPGYSNVRPGVRYVAVIGPEEDPDAAKAELMDRAKDTVRAEIDAALEANGRRPKYYDGPTFDVLVSRKRKAIIVAPTDAEAPDDFTRHGFSWNDESETNRIRLEAAEKFALGYAREREGWQAYVILEGDFSVLPPWPASRREVRGE